MLHPLAPVPADPRIRALPKADLHLHQEVRAWLDRMAAQRQGRAAFDWRAHAGRLLDGTPPGMARLDGIYAPEAALDLGGLSDADPATFVARVAALLEAEAADGAVLVEVRFGADQVVDRPDFMTLFRAAEQQVRAQYPLLCAEAIGYLHPVADRAALGPAALQLEACLHAARAGLGGVDLRVDPYETDADPAVWEAVYGWTARAAAAGLGVTVHAGEFSPANLQAALAVPGLRRLGHGVYAASEPRLLEAVARSGVTVECSLTCNVILGAVPSYAAHPIRRFVEYGIPVTLNTDLPLHTGTTIGREYAIAAALGFAPSTLLEFTRNAVRAAFTSAERRATLLSAVDAWAADAAIDAAAPRLG